MVPRSLLLWVCTPSARAVGKQMLNAVSAFCLFSPIKAKIILGFLSVSKKTDSNICLS